MMQDNMVKNESNKKIVYDTRDLNLWYGKDKALKKTLLPQKEAAIFEKSSAYCSVIRS